MAYLYYRMLLTTLILGVVVTFSSAQFRSSSNISIDEKTWESVRISWTNQVENQCLAVVVQWRPFRVRSAVGKEIDGTYQWSNHSVPISTVYRYSSPEIQSVTTHVDEESSISSGEFWLRCDVQDGSGKLPYHKLESSTISHPIQFNATADAFEKAVRKISGISHVRVFRYESTSRIHIWHVEFDVDGKGNIPLFQVHRETLDGTFRGANRVSVKRLSKERPTEYHKNLTANINGLESESMYDVRVAHEKCVDGPSLLSDLIQVKTDAIPPEAFVPDALDNASKEQLESNHVIRLSGLGWYAANMVDADYLDGSGFGGLDAANGRGGLIVVVAYGSEDLLVLRRTRFLSNGSVQSYEVPDLESPTDSDSMGVSVIDIKLWGGGGSGGGSPPHEQRNNSDQIEGGLSNGGAGGFTQTRIKVSPGEVISFFVGAGGKVNPLDFDGVDQVGYNTGGKGGISVMGPYAGSGGGFSAAFRSNGQLIAMAGGGAGGGATDYCCSHGGAGSGFEGESGSSPETPSSLGEIQFDHTKVRNDFSPKNCIDEDCIDPRDKYGLPPHHKHLDLGFAPAAEYTQICYGGIGGGLIGVGEQEKRSEYIVYDDGIRAGVSKSELHKYIGGKGSDGKEAGGGGGSGFVGGSGGGAGVDGCGGGGGSGFVDYSAVYVGEDVNDFASYLPPPDVAEVRHDALIIRWDYGKENKRIVHTIRFYQIELALGGQGRVCSDSYNVVDNIIAQYKGQTRIEELSPSTTYCIRLVAVGEHGINRKSLPTTIQTLSAPTNIWRLSYPRDNTDASAVITRNTSFCEPMQYPTERRGHSISFLNGHVYLFGGLTKICICRNTENESNPICSESMVHSNEVWMLNPLTNIWKLLGHSLDTTNALVPKGREQHSATVLPNGKIIIIGGKNEDFVFGDVWELDVGEISSHTFSHSKQGITPLPLEDGDIFYEPQHITLVREGAGRTDASLCVADLVVTVTLNHPCVEQILSLSLFGPLGNEVMFYRRSGTYESDQCTHFNSTLRFGNGERNSFLTTDDLINTDADVTASTTHKPLEDFEIHYKAIPSGKWTLAIHDGVRDGLFGMLHDWTLTLAVNYCTDEATWSKLSSNACDSSPLPPLQKALCPEEDHMHTESKAMSRDLFTPRYLHSAIAVRDDVYIFGGFAFGDIAETWRFSYSSKTFTRLKGDHHNRAKHGRMSVLTPYGIIALGGISTEEIKNTHETLNDTVYLYNVLTEQVSKLGNDEIFSSNGIGPTQRYLGGLVFIRQSHFKFQTDILNHGRLDKSLVDPALLIFGGDRNAPDNAFLADQWIFTLGHLHLLKKEDLRASHNEICMPWLKPNRTDDTKFDWSCAALADVNSVEPCRWEDVVFMAWCTEQYNSFTSPF